MRHVSVAIFFLRNSRGVPYKSLSKLQLNIVLATPKLLQIKGPVEEAWVQILLVSNCWHWLHQYKSSSPLKIYLYTVIIYVIVYICNILELKSIFSSTFTRLMGSLKVSCPQTSPQVKEISAALTKGIAVMGCRGMLQGKQDPQGNLDLWNSLR